MKHTLIAVMLCLFAVAAAADDAQVVAAAYPQRLLTEYAADYQIGDVPAVEFSNFASAGDDLLVAAYTNGFTGAIRVLRRDGTVVSEPAMQFSGVVPSVTAVNLDGSGADEIIVGFSSPRGRETNWIFRRTGVMLDLIAPPLIDAGWLDLDGDGQLELYSPAGDYAPFDAPPAPSLFDTWKLSPTGYVAGTSVSYARSFKRATGAPVAVNDTVNVAPGAYVLHVGNRGSSSATVMLNGVALVTPNMLNETVHTLTADVTLESMNTLSVELGGKPGSSLTISFEPK